jgi:hypothetical protein
MGRMEMETEGEGRGDGNGKTGASDQTGGGDQRR